MKIKARLIGGPYDGQETNVFDDTELLQFTGPIEALYTRHQVMPDDVVTFFFVGGSAGSPEIPCPRQPSPGAGQISADSSV